MATSKVKGLDRLKRQIASLPRLQVEEVGLALDEGSEQLSGAIAGACRDDEKLSASVGWARGEAPKNAKLKSAKFTAAQAVKSKAGLFRTIFAGDDNAFWARWRENGTAPHLLTKDADSSSNSWEQRRIRKRGGAMHPGARAQPFFFPSIRAWKKPMKARVAKASRVAAKRAAAVR